MVRNLLAFWLLGLCNNTSVSILMTGARDVLSAGEDPLNASAPINLTEGDRDCNQLSTGAVLLANILPDLAFRLLAPLFIDLIPYGSRVMAMLWLQGIGLIIVAFSGSVLVSLLGVVVASIGIALGEVSFLSLSSFFDKNVISTWSSGTGAASIYGSLAYAGLTQAGLSPSYTMLIHLWIPVAMAFSYWFLMVIPQSVHRVDLWDVNTWLKHHQPFTESTKGAEHMSLGEKLLFTVTLLRYILPLAVVYCAQYFINQGLHELIVFSDISLDSESQYRWYQVVYRLGVFVSRSSVNLISIPSRFLFVPALLQVVNVGVFVAEAYYLFIPSIWIVFVLILYEGLLAGFTYVNTFYRVRREVDTGRVEFGLGTTSVAGSVGITVAGLAAIPTHNAICQTPFPHLGH